MRKRESFIISHEEFVKLAKLREVTFDHEITSRMPTVVKPLLRAFIGEDGEEVTRRQAVDNLLGTMESKGLVTLEKVRGRGSWQVDIVPQHRFSAFDEDGYASSIYTVKVEVYKETYLTD